VHLSLTVPPRHRGGTVMTLDPIPKRFDMCSSLNRFMIVLFAAALGVSVGCGGTNYTPAQASDPNLARQSLQVALDTWKSGESAQVLANQSPRLYVGDEDWRQGLALKEYKLLGDGEPFGNNVRFEVGLELAGKSGTESQKSVRYVVATSPVCSVMRDDRID
jgi:hypothetical protein